MFSLRTLLLAVAIAAIGAVGLTTRNVSWASLISTFTLASIAAAIIGTIVWRGQMRLFAIGFAVCGGFYFCAIFGQLFIPLTRTLVSTRVALFAWQALDIRTPQGQRLFVSKEEQEKAALVSLERSTLSDDQWHLYDEIRSFFVVAHCLWAWLFGFLGALLAAYLARERVSRHAETSTQPP